MNDNDGRFLNNAQPLLQSGNDRAHLHGDNDGVADGIASSDIARSNSNGGDEETVWTDVDPSTIHWCDPKPTYERATRSEGISFGNRRGQTSWQAQA